MSQRTLQKGFDFFLSSFYKPSTHRAIRGTIGYSALKLVFAALTRATRRWQKIYITELEQKQVQKLRQSLELDPDRNSGLQKKQLESKKIVASA